MILSTGLFHLRSKQYIQYTIHTYIFTKTYNIIINPNSINSPSHHVLISLTVWHSSTNMRDSSFLNGELLAFYSSTRQQIQETKAQSFISRRIHNLKIVFLDPTIRTAELIFPNAKSLDRNCSSIMLRRGTI